MTEAEYTHEDFARDVKNAQKYMSEKVCKKLTGDKDCKNCKLLICYGGCPAWGLDVIDHEILNLIP